MNAGQKVRVLLGEPPSFRRDGLIGSGWLDRTDTSTVLQEDSWRVCVAAQRATSISGSEVRSDARRGLRHGDVVCRKESTRW